MQYSTGNIIADKQLYSRNKIENYKRINIDNNNVKLLSSYGGETGGIFSSLGPVNKLETLSNRFPYLRSNRDI